MADRLSASLAGADSPTPVSGMHPATEGTSLRLLVIEDGADMAEALGAALGAAGHTWKVVSRGSDALTQHREYQMLLLDLGLPDMDGFQVLTKLRAVSAAPIIVLTGRREERDVVRALRLGADDYLIKPFRLSELLARIDAVARRRSLPPTQPLAPIEADGLTIDLAARTVRRGNSDVPLTRTEFDVLAVLCERPGEAVSRELILDRVWGDTGASTSRSLSVHLTQLRAKLDSPGLIKTLRGHGYRFN